MEEVLNFQRLTDHGCKAAKEWFSNSPETVPEIVAKLMLLRMHFNMQKSIGTDITGICEDMAATMVAIGRDQGPLFLDTLQQTVGMVAAIQRAELQRAELQRAAPPRHAPQWAGDSAVCTPPSCRNTQDSISKRLDLEYSPPASLSSVESACLGCENTRTSYVQRRSLFIAFATEALVQEETLTVKQLAEKYCRENPSVKPRSVLLFSLMLDTLGELANM
jgi:hypothetical protein